MLTYGFEVWGMFIKMDFEKWDKTATVDKFLGEMLEMDRALELAETTETRAATEWNFKEFVKRLE